MIFYNYYFTYHNGLLFWRYPGVILTPSVPRIAVSENLAVVVPFPGYKIARMAGVSSAGKREAIDCGGVGWG
jgi:hypothetical protein